MELFSIITDTYLAIINPNLNYSAVIIMKNTTQFYYTIKIEKNWKV